MDNQIIKDFYCIDLILYKMNNIKAAIDTILSQKDKTIPSLPRHLTKDDIKALEDAVQSAIGKKVQSALLKLLLADAYQQVGSEKFSRQISDIGFQSLQQTPYQIEARLKICELITNAYDESKLDFIKFHFNQFNVNPAMSEAKNKIRVDIIKAGVEALKENYYKAAIGFFNASKDQVLSNSQQERVNLIEKSILMCFLANRNKQLHRLVCQLYINPLAKKCQSHFLLMKLYSEAIIDAQEGEDIRKLLPEKFWRKGPENVSILSKAIFIHNMMPILKCFESISLQTLCELTGMKEDELLLMIERSFTKKELQIDQVSGYLHVKEDKTEKDKILIKTLFDNLESLVASPVDKN